MTAPDAFECGQAALVEIRRQIGTLLMVRNNGGFTDRDSMEYDHLLAMETALLAERLGDPYGGQERGQGLVGQRLFVLQ